MRCLCDLRPVSFRPLEISRRPEGIRATEEDLDSSLGSAIGFDEMTLSLVLMFCLELRYCICGHEGKEWEGVGKEVS